MSILLRCSQYYTSSLKIKVWLRNHPDCPKDGTKSWWKSVIFSRFPRIPRRVPWSSSHTSWGFGVLAMFLGFKYLLSFYVWKPWGRCDVKNHLRFTPLLSRFPLWQPLVSDLEPPQNSHLVRFGAIHWVIELDWWYDSPNQSIYGWCWCHWVMLDIFHWIIHI